MEKINRSYRVLERSLAKKHCVGNVFLFDFYEKKRYDKKTMNESIEQQIEKVLEQVRPALRMDGGGIDFISFNPDTGVVQVRMQGACVGCPMSEITLKMGVEAALCDALPEVKEVVTIS